MIEASFSTASLVVLLGPMPIIVFISLIDYIKTQRNKDSSL